MTEDAWDTWTGWFVEELRGMEEGQFCNTWGPARTREGGTGRFGRQRKPAVLEPATVIMLHMGSHLLVESVHAFPVQDDRMNDEVRERLRGIGWLLPGDEGYVDGEARLRVYIPADDVEEAAALTAQTYPLLGVDDPALVEVERGS